MNRHSTHPDESDERLQKQAAEWLARLNGEMSEDEHEAFEKWLEEDPRHVSALGDLQGNLDRLCELRKHIPIPAGEPDPDLLVRASPKHRLPFAIMATAAIAAGLALFLALRPSIQPDFSEASASVAVHQTEAGGFERVELADGTVVALNESTRLDVKFNPDRRIVRLVKGEAHFDVAKDAARPFVVELGKVSVQAVGTAFNIRSTTHEVRVLVTEGRVAILTESNSGPSLSSPPAAADPAYLGIGEQAVVDTTTESPRPSIGRLEQAQIDRELSWTGPRLHFQGTPLSKAVRQFNEHNALQVELADESAGSIAIGGSFAAKDVESFLRLLSRYETIEVRRSAEDRAIIHRRTQ